MPPLCELQIIPASCDHERGLRVHVNLHYVFETDQYCDGARILISSTHKITYLVANLQNYLRISGIDFRESLSFFKRNYYNEGKHPQASISYTAVRKLCTYQSFSGPWGGRADPQEIDFFEKILSNSRPLGKYCFVKFPSLDMKKIQ